MYLYPIGGEIDHEGFLPTTRLLLSIPSLRTVKAEDDLQIPSKFTEHYILARVHRKEYESNTQLHRVEFYMMKPFIQTRNYDYYVFEILEVAKCNGRVPSKWSDAVPVTALGIIAFRVAKGYRETWLVRKLTPHEFLDLAEEFTRLYAMHLLLR